eukprot:TRINITY_DN68989_c0_g1_i1.p1 TRINITY_DN68989_c0_g1~~TRINITY_DN68989_c0_g1_i1.p1  ORF type:complete len:136 (+),score=31.17 TRINITY_DN68989_c0_g1_i1:64-471(+)
MRACGGGAAAARKLRKEVDSAIAKSNISNQAQASAARTAATKPGEKPKDVPAMGTNFFDASTDAQQVMSSGNWSSVATMRNIPDPSEFFSANSLDKLSEISDGASDAVDSDSDDECNAPTVRRDAVTPEFPAKCE